MFCYFLKLLFLLFQCKYCPHSSTKQHNRMLNLKWHLHLQAQIIIKICQSNNTILCPHLIYLRLGGTVCFWFYTKFNYVLLLLRFKTKSNFYVRIKGSVTTNEIRVSLNSIITNIVLIGER